MTTKRVTEYYLRLDDGSYGYHADSDYLPVSRETFNDAVAKNPGLVVDKFTSIQKGYIVTNYCLDFYLYSKNGDKNEHV